ncbi:MAG: hypothetical protein RLY20_1509 [Verrucomicrobiota bacterium]
MANTLTNLIPDAYAALNVVSRELVGFVSSVTRDSRADRVATGQTLRSPVGPAQSVATITPAMAIPAAADQTFTNKTLTIGAIKGSGFSWTGEEQYAMNGGPGYATLRQNQIAEAIRAVVNEMENDVADAVAAAASRAYGTAGTAPFGTANDLSDVAYVTKILDDNGAPAGDRQLVLSTAAMASLRAKQSSLFKVNEAGSEALLRRGEVGMLQNFMVRQSAQCNTNTAGTGASYLLNGALAVGDTTVTVDTGSGTILAGDIVTIGSHKYVVATALSGGSFTINAPGIVAAAADNLAITVNATSTRNCAFTRSAVVLATRLPVVPEGGDLALDRQIITDEVSGLSFEMTLWPGAYMNKVQIAAVWGVSVFNPKHTAILLG